MSLVARERIGFLRLAGYHWQNSVSAHQGLGSEGGFAGFLVVEPLGVRGWNNWPTPVE